MALKRLLGLIGLAMALSAPAYAAGDAPFASGFYVPADLSNSCK